MWWLKCVTVRGLCLSTSLPLSQYYSAHALYSASSNVARTSRKKGKYLETFKKQYSFGTREAIKKIVIQWLGANTWAPDLRKGLLNADGQTKRRTNKMKLTFAYHYFADNLNNSVNI